MIFPAQDRQLLTYELSTYGITYSDTDDCLLIAPPLKGHPECITDVVWYLAPLEIVGLLFYDEDFIGVIFPSVTEQVHYYWNGVLTEEIPTDYLADMIDLCLADLRVQHIVEDGKELLEARVAHACARRLIQGSGYLPPPIIERMRHSIGEFTPLVH